MNNSVEAAVTSMAAAVQAAVQKQQLSEQQQQLTQQQLALAVQAAQNAATIATSSQSVSQSMFFERYVILQYLETNAKNPNWPKIWPLVKNPQFLSNEADIKVTYP